MDITQVLKDMVLVDIIIGGSTGERTLEADDFIREVGKMLPMGTFSWVSKARADAKRAILKVGASRKVDNRVRGYFVPLNKAAQLSDDLKALRDEFEVNKAEFLKNLPKIISDWAAHPQNDVELKPGLKRADLIRLHAPKVIDMDKLLRFAMSATHISSSKFFGEEDALHSEVKGLPAQAAYEIADDVKKSWKGAVGGKTTSRVLGLVRRIRNKADALSILSTKFTSLTTTCDKVLAQMPATGNIEGVAFMQVSALLEFCSRPENILSDQSTTFDPVTVIHDEPETQQQELMGWDEKVPAVTPVSQPAPVMHALEF